MQYRNKTGWISLGWSIKSDQLSNRAHSAEAYYGFCIKPEVTETPGHSANPSQGNT